MDSFAPSSAPRQGNLNLRLHGEEYLQLVVLEGLFLHKGVVDHEADPYCDHNESVDEHDGSGAWRGKEGVRKRTYS